MAKNVTLAPITTLQNSSIIATVNANDDLIEEAFTDCLSLSGEQPNAMQSNLDMNGNQIINLPAPSTLDSPVRLVDVTNGTIQISQGLVNGVTTITGGTNGEFLFDNAGVIGFATPAGGGGGSSAPFATIGALAALSPPITPTFAIVSDPIRGGTFIWTTGDQSTFVTNDPGQGIYVAPASASSGTSGAWIRQYDGPEVHAEWWGYVADATATIDPWSLDTFTTTATGTSGTAILTVTSTTGILPGMSASGTNIPVFVNTTTSSTVVLSVNVGASQITLSRNLLGNITGGTITFYGPVVGTGTDNAPALINMGKWARTQNSVYIKFPAGTAIWNGSTQSPTGTTDARNFGYGWTVGIPNLTIDGGGGAIWQNSYNQAISGANAAFGATFPPSDILEIQGFLINNTVLNATSFTLINSGDVATSGIVPGMMIALACNDQQFLGYPPNPGQFEFLTISSIVGTTVNVVENIKYIHRTDFPDFNLTPGISSTCGAARMWVMPDLAWQGSLVVKGLQVNLSPAMPQGFYASLVKRSVQTINWVGPGFSESFCQNVIHDNPSTHSSGETDKFVDVIQYNNPNSAAGGAFAFQSSNPNKLFFNGGSVDTIIGVGKQTYINGTKIGTFLPSATLGMSTSTILERCDITSASGTSLGSVIDGAKLAVIDGVNVTWANGFITIVPLAITGSIGNWAVTPGMWCNLQGSTVNGNLFSNDLGTGVIQSITQTTVTVGTTTTTASTFPGNTITVVSAVGLLPGMAVSGTGIGVGATIVTVVGLVVSLSVANTSSVSGTITFTQPNIILETSLKQFATIPTWSTGSIYFFKINEVICRNCIGADSIRVMSDASEAQQRYFEYRKFEFAGIEATGSMTINQPSGCQLTEVDVYVQNPSSIANSNLILTLSTMAQPASSASPYVNDSGGTIINIRMDIAGLRRITTSSFDGYPTGTGTLDHITVAGSASSFLPTNRIVGPTFNLQFPNPAGSTAASPVGYVIFKFSAGMARTPLSRKYDDNGAVTLAHTIMPIQNSLP